MNAAARHVKLPVSVLRENIRRLHRAATLSCVKGQRLPGGWSLKTCHVLNLFYLLDHTFRVVSPGRASHAHRRRNEIHDFIWPQVQLVYHLQHTDEWIIDLDSCHRVWTSWAVVRPSVQFVSCSKPVTCCLQRTAALMEPWSKHWVTRHIKLQTSYLHVNLSTWGAPVSCLTDTCQPIKEQHYVVWLWSVLCVRSCVPRCCRYQISNTHNTHRCGRTSAVWIRSFTLWASAVRVGASGVSAETANTPGNEPKQLVK